MINSSNLLIIFFIAMVAAQALSFNFSPRHLTKHFGHENSSKTFVNGNHAWRMISPLLSSSSKSGSRSSSSSSSRLAIKRDELDEDTIAESESLSPNLVKLEKSTRAKIISESIAPWRTFRLFVCATLGSGAALGGLITLAGLVAGLTGARSDVDIQTESVNLAIDFGAAGLFALIAKVDLDRGSKLEEKVGTNLEKKAERKEIYKAMKQREQNLATLNLAIRVSADGQITQASVRAIQEGAKQNIIIVVGPKQAIKDALVGASLLKMNNFAMTNVLVVPYEVGDTSTAQIRPSGGFGEKAIWETRPYVAEAVGEGWDEYIAAEMADAEKQCGSDVKEKGIAIIVGSNGQVVRRGVGRIPWRQTLEQLNEMKATKDTEEYVSLL